MTLSRRRRKQAYLKGHWAEAVALLALMLKGYWPLMRRYSAYGGEIDLIVRRGNTIVFVEVKARKDTMTAFESITAHKQRLFSRAASAWVSKNPVSLQCHLRADAVLVVPWKWPKHFICAFEMTI